MCSAEGDGAAMLPFAGSSGSIDQGTGTAAAAAVQEVTDEEAARAAQQLELVVTPKKGEEAGDELDAAAEAARAAIGFSAGKQEAAPAAHTPLRLPALDALSGDSSDGTDSDAAAAAAAPRRILYRAISHHA